jgi:hypothetical protein
MPAWRDWLLALMSRDWAGLLVALAVAAASAFAAGVLPGAAGGVLALVGGVLAAVLAGASLRHLVTLARARRAHPPPGRMIDLGGYRVHLLAEGQTREGRPAVVWFAPHGPARMYSPVSRK